MHTENLTYQLACTESLPGNALEAINALRNACEMDRGNARMAALDSDLSGLRAKAASLELLAEHLSSTVLDLNRGVWESED